MQFIHCFDNGLKTKLLQSGFELLVETNGFFIFTNNTKLKFNFSEVNPKQFIFSNKMTF